MNQETKTNSETNSIETERWLAICDNEVIFSGTRTQCLSFVAFQQDEGREQNWRVITTDRRRKEQIKGAPLFSEHVH